MVTIHVNSRYIYSTQRNRETELQACTRTAVRGYAIPVNVGFTPHINIGDVSTFPGELNWRFLAGAYI